MKVGTSLRFLFPAGPQTAGIYQSIVAALPPGAFTDRPMGAEDVVQQADNLVEVARAARASNLWGLLVGDNHAIPAQYANMFQPVPTIARLSAETGPMMVGMVLLAPFYHPAPARRADRHAERVRRCADRRHVRQRWVGARVRGVRLPAGVARDALRGDDPSRAGPLGWRGRDGVGPVVRARRRARSLRCLVARRRSGSQARTTSPWNGRAASATVGSPPRTPRTACSSSSSSCTGGRRTRTAVHVAPCCDAMCTWPPPTPRRGRTSIRSWRRATAVSTTTACWSDRPTRSWVGSGSTSRWGSST